nr:MAG TPA: hypothetical protein [Caudoviricetes sp.]DAN68099.1 MAG TPA: hypothetical protein [Caudoviricetes sp.]
MSIEVKSMDQFQSLCRKKFKNWWQISAIRRNKE